MAPSNWRALRKDPAVMGEAPLQLNLGNTSPHSRKKTKVSKGTVSMPVVVNEVSEVSTVTSIPTSSAFEVGSTPVRTTQVTVPISPLPPPPVSVPSSSQPQPPTLMQRYDSSVPLTGLDHVSFSPNVRSLWSAHFSASDILPSDVLIGEADRALMETVGPGGCFRSAETFLTRLMGMMRYHASKYDNMAALAKTTQVEASKVARLREILNVEHDKHMQALVAFSASVKSNMTLSARVQELIGRFSDMRRGGNNLYEKLATTEVEREALRANLEEVNNQNKKLYAENEKLKKENDELKAAMLEAKRGLVNEHKIGFEKAVRQSLLFHPELDAQRFDLYKDVVDGELMNESDIEYQDEDNPEEE